MVKVITPITTKGKATSPVLSASNWFIRSGIQDMEADSKFRGGVYAWHDLRNGSYPFIYSEITGYAINAFLFFHRITGNPIYLERARLAGDWLAGARDKKYGLIPTRLSRAGDDNAYYDCRAFTFDQWIVVCGLCSLFTVTENRVYLKCAEEIAAALLGQTLQKDGFMYPTFNLKSGRPEATNDKWSRQPGAFHAKAALGLGQLYHLTHNERYFSCALKLAERALMDQKEDGRFITQTSDQSTHLHPHLYALEGILYLGTAQNDKKLIDVCKKGLTWILNSALEDGTIYCFFKNQHFVPYERADVLAQTLRLATIMGERVSHFQRFRLKLDRIREKLLLYQVSSGPQEGGFFYGQEENGTIHFHLNAWVTMFAAQALWLYDHSQVNDSKYDFSFFV